MSHIITHKYVVNQIQTTGHAHNFANAGYKMFHPLHDALATCRTAHMFKSREVD